MNYNLEMDEHQKKAHKAYIQALIAMGPESRLERSFELSEMSITLFRQGLQEQFPGLSEEEFQALFMRRIALCYNRNW